MLPAVLLIGAGLGTLSPVAANLATLGVAASAVFNAAGQAGAPVGAAVLNTIAATSAAAYLAAHPHRREARLAAAVHGYTAAAAWAAVILAAGAIVVLVLVHARPHAPGSPS